MTRRWIGWITMVAAISCATGNMPPVNSAESGHTSQFTGTFAGEVTLGDYRNATLMTVHEDGTITSSDGNDFEGAGHGRFNSPAYGAWRNTGDHTTAFTFREFEFDSTGHLLGTATIDGTGNSSVDYRDVTGTMSVTDWHGQPAMAGLRFRLRRIEPVAR